MRIVDGHLSLNSRNGSNRRSRWRELPSYIRAKRMALRYSHEKAEVEYVNSERDSVGED